MLLREETLTGVSICAEAIIGNMRTCFRVRFFVFWVAFFAAIWYDIIVMLCEVEYQLNSHRTCFN